jgi:hypothetical protein
MRLTILSLVFITIPIFLQAENDHSSKNIYDSLIQPIFAAKCQECHGSQKSKGKLKLHTKKDFLIGGSGAGQDIVVKGNAEESELIFRITLPKEDDEAMPPMEDASHYNPVTVEELEVMKGWISLGAKFELLISDLDDKKQKSAFHVLNNMPQRLLSKTLALQPKLPTVPAANPIVLENLRKHGILVMPIAQNTNTIYVNASYVGKDFDDNKIALLEPIAEQLLWLNLARTGITDKGIATLEKYTLLTRLHLENTSISDAATVHLSKLSNLEYLNLYATQVSDVSVPYLQKIDQLKKIFLWQTKITPQGAEALRRHFVDAGEYDSLMAQKKVFKTSLDNLINTEELKFQKLEQDLLQASAITKDKEVINKKCPVTQKSIDPSKISIFEGRKIGFCCDKCKSKFDADGAVFRSKIKDFKASDEFLALVENMQNARLSKDNTIETSQQKLRILTGKLSKMGPQINLGFNKPVVSK